MTEVVLKALGAEWHSECFTCNVSGSMPLVTTTHADDALGMQWTVRGWKVLLERVGAESGLCQVRGPETQSIETSCSRARLLNLR